MIQELADYLSDITGLAGCTFQPNSGAQGEYTGLLMIRAYHEDRGDEERKLILIPSSAHGTNPASAVLAGYQVKIVNSDDHGNIDLQHLTSVLNEQGNRVAGLMVTYPSTHGVFEEGIVQICEMV